jgi:hypothetical protein
MRSTVECERRFREALVRTGSGVVRPKKVEAKVVPGKSCPVWGSTTPTTFTTFPWQLQEIVSGFSVCTHQLTLRILKSV